MRQLISGRDHCIHHSPTCTGVTRQLLPCKKASIEKTGFMYCEHHALGPLGTDPAKFRLPNLRNDRASAVILFRDGKDAYTKKSVDLHNLRDFQLDHTVELQVPMLAVDKLAMHGTSSSYREAEKAFSDELRTILNATANLNFTSKQINMVKFDGNRTFLEEYKLGMSSDGGLVGALLAASGEIKLTRDETRRIGLETRRSADYIVQTLEESDSALSSTMVDNLIPIFTAMRLPLWLK